jgi:methylmalonyl-CoA mutase cobalamin-binding domain/chain
LPLVHEVMARLKENGAAEVPVVGGGIIPPQDARALKDAGVAEVYTPKDFALNRRAVRIGAANQRKPNNNATWTRRFTTPTRC